MIKSEVWGATYIEPGETRTVRPGDRDRYHYTAFVREDFQVEEGDSAFVLRIVDGKVGVEVVQHGAVACADFGVVIRGIMMERQSMIVGPATFLPYVNGCSTKQLFPPARAGDPTFQYLDIPPHSKEQAHHIHSTTRVVYILSGRGQSIVGMEGKLEVTELVPGMVCVLEPMCPHHFETPQGQHLICLPVHVWSSTPSEFNHPMFLGTHMMDQGT